MFVCLTETVGKKLDLDLRGDTLVQYIIYGIEDGHVDMHVAVDLLHTLRTEVALGNHLHLNLCRFHAVALTNHGTEGAVTREVAVASYEEVAHINRVVDVPFDGVNGVQEPVHLLHSVRHQYALEVITVFQSAAGPCGNGLDILQNR